MKGISDFRAQKSQRANLSHGDPVGDLHLVPKESFHLLLLIISILCGRRVGKGVSDLHQAQGVLLTPNPSRAVGEPHWDISMHRNRSGSELSFLGSKWRLQPPFPHRQECL